MPFKSVSSSPFRQIGKLNLDKTKYACSKISISVYICIQRRGQRGPRYCTLKAKIKRIMTPQPYRNTHTQPSFSDCNSLTEHFLSIQLRGKIWRKFLTKRNHTTGRYLFMTSWGYAFFTKDFLWQKITFYSTARNWMLKNTFYIVFNLFLVNSLFKILMSN